MTSEDDPALGRHLDDRRAARHPADDHRAAQAQARPGDQARRRAGHACPEQERHADHGRHRHHHRLAGRLRARALVHRRPDDRLRRARAVPDDRPRLRRLPRRLHQAVHAPQPRPAQRGQAARPGDRRRDLRGPGDPLPRRLRPDPGVDAHLVPRRLRRLHRRGAVRGLGAGHGHRHFQRGEPHRRPRRPRDRRVDPRPGRLRDHRELAATATTARSRSPRTATTSATRSTPRWSPPS